MQLLDFFLPIELQIHYLNAVSWGQRDSTMIKYLLSAHLIQVQSPVSHTSQVCQQSFLNAVSG